MPRAKVQALSLFSGAGGLDRGLESAGIRVKLQIDNDPLCCETLRVNNPKARIVQEDLLKTDIMNIIRKEGLRGDIDVVVGGPPCQPFSKSVHWSNPDGSKRSPLKNLPLLLIDVAAQAEAKAFMLENVPGLCSTRHRDLFNQIINRAKKLGFSNITFKVLDASNFDVPQKRKRLFIIAFKEDNDFSYSDIKTCNEVLTCSHAFRGLNMNESFDELEVNGKWGKYLPIIPPGYNYQWLTEKGGSRKKIFKYRSRYWNFLLKLHPDRLSWTIQSSPGPYTGPFHWENRRLTISELKRLQGLPDDYIISGDRREQIRQIGNCVPPPMAQAVGEAVARYL